MTIVILPDAQADLLGLQDCMLDRWRQASWLKAEDEIFDKLEQVDAGFSNAIDEAAIEGLSRSAPARNIRTTAADASPA